MGEHVERQFVLTILEEDLEEKYSDDLKGHISMAIGDALEIDSDVSFSVEDVDECYRLFGTTDTGAIVEERHIITKMEEETV